MSEMSTCSPASGASSSPPLSATDCPSPLDGATFTSVASGAAARAEAAAAAARSRRRPPSPTPSRSPHGSGRLCDTDAVLTASPTAVARAVTLIDATAPCAIDPMLHEEPEHDPWLALTEIEVNCSEAGSVSLTSTPVAGPTPIVAHADEKRPTLRQRPSRCRSSSPSARIRPHARRWGRRRWRRGWHDVVVPDRGRALAGSDGRVGGRVRKIDGEGLTALRLSCLRRPRPRSAPARPALRSSCRSSRSNPRPRSPSHRSSHSDG